MWSLSATAHPTTGNLRGEQGAGRTLVIITQVYVPDPAAVGQHMADAAEEMARRGWRVIVFTSARGYEDPTTRYPRREVRNGVSVRRLSLSSFGKSSLTNRLLGQVLFILQSTIAACFLWRVDAVLVSTSPPFAHAAGLVVSVIRRAPLTWWVMDLNPDQILASGKASSRSVLVRLLDWLNRQALKRARSIVVLDRFMEQRLRAKGPVAAAMHVLPPWPLADRIHAATAAETTRFRQKHGLDGRFVVMYSGNHSPQNPLDTVLQAAIAMRDDDRVRFVFVGGGRGKQAVDDLVRKGAPNIVSLPYQPLATLGDVLAAADLHVVTMGDDMVGIVHPCKVYGVLTAGRPFVFVGPRESHVGEILEAASAGWQVSHGDVTGFQGAVEAAMAAGAEALEKNGMCSRQFATTHFSRRDLLGRFTSVISPAAAP